MAKGNNKSLWNGPQGSKSMDKDPLVRKHNRTGFDESQTDISDRVDRAQQVHKDGFASKLPRSK
jgi:hypothetical protein